MQRIARVPNSMPIRRDDQELRSHRMQIDENKIMACCLRVSPNPCQRDLTARDTSDIAALRTCALCASPYGTVNAKAKIVAASVQIPTYRPMTAPLHSRTPTLSAMEGSLAVKNSSWRAATMFIADITHRVKMTNMALPVQSPAVGFATKMERTKLTANSRSKR